MTMMVAFTAGVAFGWLLVSLRSAAYRWLRRGEERELREVERVFLVALEAARAAQRKQRWIARRDLDA